MKWLILFAPLNLFGGWHADWTALEDYVNGVTNAPPQFITTNVVNDLMQATIERSKSVNDEVTAGVIGRFNVDRGSVTLAAILRKVDLFIRSEGHLFAPANWIDDGQPTAGMIDYCAFTDYAAYADQELVACPSDSDDVTVPAWNAPSTTPSFYSSYVTKWWTEAVGYPDKLALWRWQETNASPAATTQIEEHWSFLENPGFSGGLLGECIYTVTNVYTDGDDVHYQVGWKYTEHDAFDKLFRTNDWTGSDALVRASLSVPTGTHPNVEFIVQGTAFDTGDWFTWEYDAVREAWPEEFVGSRKRSAPNTTNTFTVGGAGITTYAQPVFLNLFADGIACTNTVDTTNIASVAHLGAFLAVEWIGSKASYSRQRDSGGSFDHAKRGSMFANAHALVGRKWALQAMNLTIHPVTFDDSTELKYTTSGTTSTYALAQAAYAVYETNTIGGGELHHSIVAKYTCSSDEYNIYGKSKSVAVLVENLHADLLAGAIYCVAADYTGPTLDTSTPPNSANDGYTTWQNPTDDAAFQTYYIIASATAIGAVSHTFTIAPGAVSFPPQPGAAGDIYVTGGAKTARGYRAEIPPHVLIDWDYEYE